MALYVLLLFDCYLFRVLVIISTFSDLATFAIVLAKKLSVENLFKLPGGYWISKTGTRNKVSFSTAIDIHSTKYSEYKMYSLSFLKQAAYQWIYEPGTLQDQADQCPQKVL